jgi:hypothetical protein
VDALPTHPVEGLEGLPVGGTAPLTEERQAALRDVLGAFFSSRLLVWLIGVLAVLVVGFYPGTSALLDPHHLTSPFHQRLLNILVSPATRWDSAWYLSIAKTGYVLSYQTVFFPLYPGLLAIGGAGSTGLELLVGIVVSFACAIGALYFLHRLVTLEFNARLARNTVWIVAWLPITVALSAVYSESLFLVLAIGSFYAGRRGRWALAGVLGGLASTSRNGGILLLLPLLVLYLYGPRTDRRPDQPAAHGLTPRYRLRPEVGWLALVPLGLFAYMIYLGVTVGHPLDPFTHQQHWGRTFIPLGGIPLEVWTLIKDLAAAIPGLNPRRAALITVDGVARHVYSLIFFIIAALLLRICWKRLPAAYTAFAAASLAMAASVPAHNEPLKSLPRFTLVMFPLWIALALWATENRRVRTVIAVSAPLLALSTYLFVSWSWPP